MTRSKRKRTPRVVLLETSRLADLDGRIEKLADLYNDLMACRDVLMTRTSELLTLFRAIEATNLDVQSALDRRKTATARRRKDTNMAPAGDVAPFQNEQEAPPTSER